MKPQAFHCSAVPRSFSIGFSKLLLSVQLFGEYDIGTLVTKAGFGGSLSTLIRPLNSVRQRRLHNEIPFVPTVQKGYTGTAGAGSCELGSQGWLALRLVGLMHDLESGVRRSLSRC